MMMKPGNRVRISGDAGIAIGKVLDIRTPGELPHIDERSSAELVTKILMEWHVVRVAVIEVTYGGYVFMALEVDGRWFDLHERELRIEILKAGEYGKSKSRCDYALRRKVRRGGETLSRRSS
jgi:hypothetical protein